MVLGLVTITQMLSFDKTIMIIDPDPRYENVISGVEAVHYAYLHVP